MSTRAVRGNRMVTVYKVRSGDTLWSIAVDHGTTVRDICDANGWAGQGPVIYEGQPIRLPVRACPPPPENADTSAVPDLWEGASTRVQALTAVQVEDLTLASPYRPASHDTLLVVYAPWCPFCREIEEAVEQVARSLEKDPSVVVAKVRAQRIPWRRTLSSWSQRCVPSTLPSVAEALRDPTARLLSPSSRSSEEISLSPSSRSSEEIFLARARSPTQRLVPRGSPPFSPSPETTAPRSGTTAPGTRRRSRRSSSRRRRGAGRPQGKPRKGRGRRRRPRRRWCSPRWISWRGALRPVQRATRTYRRGLPRPFFPG